MRWGLVGVSLCLVADVAALRRSSDKGDREFMKEMLPFVFDHKKRTDIRPCGQRYTHVGHGGMGEIFKGEFWDPDTRNWNPVAIKVIYEDIQKYGEETVKNELAQSVKACAEMRTMRHLPGAAAERLIDCHAAFQVTSFSEDAAFTRLLKSKNIDIPPKGFAFVIHILEWAGTAAGGRDGMIAKWGQTKSGWKIVLMVKQMLMALQHVHSRGKVVLDMKFKNMCVVNTIFGYPFIKLIDLEGMQPNTPQEARQSHVATSQYHDRYMLMMKSIGRKDDSGKSAFPWGSYFCGAATWEYKDKKMPQNAKAYKQFCPFGHAQDIWSVGMATVQELCNIGKFPSSNDWGDLSERSPHLWNKFPTSHHDFTKWLQRTSGSKSSSNTNFCKEMDHQQLGALWGMLKPNPWERLTADALLKLPLFSQKPHEKGFINQQALAVGALLESGLMSLNDFMRHKESLKGNFVWRELVDGDQETFVASSTYLECDPKGLKIMWNKGQGNSAPRFIHLGYLGPLSLKQAPAGPWQVHLPSNRTNCKKGVKQHDKSCKHSKLGEVKVRESPLVVQFASRDKALAFQNALSSLAGLQQKVAPPAGFEANKIKQSGFKQPKKNKRQLRYANPP